MRMYELHDRVQYRFEPNLEDGLFLIYNSEQDEFRTGGEVVRDVVRAIDDEKPPERITQELIVENDMDRNDAVATVRYVCEEFRDAGFLREIDGFE